MTSLFEAAKSTVAFIQFVEGQGLVDALSAIGDTNLEAAKIAIKQARTAQDRKSALWSAIPHLRQAHVAYRNIWNSTTRKALRSFSPITYDNACIKDIYVSCLLAICFIYLKEQNAERESIGWAQNALQAQEKTNLLKQADDNPLLVFNIALDFFSSITIDLPALIGSLNLPLELNGRTIEEFKEDLDERFFDMQ